MIKRGLTHKDLYVFFLIIYIICLPLNAMNIGAFGSALKVIAILPVGIAFLLGSSIRFSRPLVAQSVFTFLALSSTLWSVSTDASISRVVSYVLLLALLASGSVFTYEAKDIRRVKYALVWSSRLTAAVMLLFAEYVNGRFRLMGIIEEDPNYLCAYLAFGVVYALGALTEKNNLLPKKLLAIAELFMYLYLVLVSGSRGGLLAIMSAAAVYLMFFGSNGQTYRIKRIILIALLFVAMFVMIDYLPEILRIRFTIDDVVETGGTGRVDLWKQAIDLFTNGNLFRQIFGYGTATIVWCFQNYGYSETHVAHNMFLETLAELGIVGLVAYSTAIFSFIKTSFKERDKFAFAVIACMFVMSLSTSIYAFKPYFNIMLFIIISQNATAGDEENLEDELSTR